jgi:hypothetical protein
MLVDVVVGGNWVQFGWAEGMDDSIDFRSTH